MSDANKTPAITSANLPATAPPKPPVVEKAEPIIAKPLVDADFTKIRPKNSALTCYWGNRLANKGMRIEDLKAKQFRVAKPEELEMPDGQGGWMPLSSGYIANGQVQRGDLLCMIISKALYQGQLKYNQEMADKRVSKAANLGKGREMLGEALREVGGLPPQYRGKIGVYTPKTGDVSDE